MCQFGSCLFAPAEIDEVRSIAPPHGCLREAGLTSKSVLGANLFATTQQHNAGEPLLFMDERNSRSTGPAGTRASFPPARFCVM